MMRFTNIPVWVGIFHLVISLPVAAASSERDMTLLESISQGWAGQFRVLGFGMITEAADSCRNPDNRIMALPDSAAAMQFRPDLKLDVQRISLSLQPRAEVSWESSVQSSNKSRDQGRDEIYIHQWLVRRRFTDQLYISYGRENLQWGPASLTSLSNPFFKDNGKANPKAEVAATDFARVVWVPGSIWSVSFIANTQQGRMETSAGEDFAEAYALKTDYTGSADYGSMILTSTADGFSQIAGFYGNTMSDALLVYTEGGLQRDPSGWYPQKADTPFGSVMAEKERLDDTWTGSFLVGASYTLESDPTLTLEYLYYDLGYNSSEAEDFFALQERAAGEIKKSSVLTPLAYQVLSTTADPDLRFLRRNYLMLQYVQPDIGDVVNLTLRYTHNIDDGSGRITFIGDWFVGDHVQLFAVGTWGNGADSTEFGSIINTTPTYAVN